MKVLVFALHAMQMTQEIVFDIKVLVQMLAFQRNHNNRPHRQYFLFGPRALVIESLHSFANAVKQDFRNQRICKWIEREREGGRGSSYFHILGPLPIEQKYVGETQKNPNDGRGISYLNQRLFTLTLSLSVCLSVCVSV